MVCGGGTAGSEECQRKSIKIGSGLVKNGAKAWKSGLIVPLFCWEGSNELVIIIIR